MTGIVRSLRRCKRMLIPLGTTQDISNVDYILVFMTLT